MADPVAAAAAYGEYAAILVVAGFAVALVTAMLGAVWILTRWLGGIRHDPRRQEPYECGEAVEGSAWGRFNNRFSLVALIFIVFDVELALLLPILPRCLGWIGEGRGWVVFVEVALFVGTLLLGLVYAAVKGDFDWNKAVAGSRGRGVAGSGKP